MLLPRLPVLSALLVLLLAAGRCTAAALLRGSGTRADGRLEGRSLLEQVRSTSTPSAENISTDCTTTPGTVLYLPDKCSCFFLLSWTIDAEIIFHFLSEAVGGRGRTNPPTGPQLRSDTETSEMLNVFDVT
ncbi:hypothetical protein F2P81_002840 [Scophthalmus maximus]|uniref:Uncharacterized protein n=1 Tax=Scophthalmus maximus TaxID=52904 RepID=A0A6A4TUF1_SCOMX|nr:hypothetical protein F2P81_002840 [Scophthalmus maximus]